MKFYTEMIIVTVLSLLSASLWIEYTKGFVVRHFNNHPSALMAMALLVTLLAICFLNMLFSDASKDNGNDDDEETFIAEKHGTKG